MRNLNLQVTHIHHKYSLYESQKIKREDVIYEHFSKRTQKEK